MRNHKKGASQRARIKEKPEARSEPGNWRKPQSKSVPVLERKPTVKSEPQSRRKRSEPKYEKTIPLERANGQEKPEDKSEP